MNEMYIAVRALLIDLFANFNANAIFAANQNNIVLPDNDYIIIRILQDKPQTLQPEETYDTDSEEVMYSQLQLSTCIVDFYGEESYNNAVVLSTYLNTALCHEFLYYNHNMSLYTHDGVQNLTMNWDRGKYLSRAAVQFNLYREVNLTRSVLGYTSRDIIVTLANKEVN